MKKESAVQPVKSEVKPTEVATPVAKQNPPVATKTVAAAPKKQVATATAVKKVASKPNVTIKATPAKPAKQAVAETPTPAPAPKAPAKAKVTIPAPAKVNVADAPKADKPAKLKKLKLVRDSFTIPETDYALFASIKQRALAAGIEVKKSEILRAAVVALAKLDTAELIKAIDLVERIKTGRPKK